jgi:DNA invertase Pin-like site-specific DNA recombinase
MSTKITTEHLHRTALVYIRQSTMAQVIEHTESKRRQYALAEKARSFGFHAVEVIDDDLGRSGSGLVERPGFQRLVALVCSGSVGAVLCIEASRLARNGRDWHHLIDLCALVGTIVVDPDGVYDPRLSNDRLLLGLKGTMSEYELNLLRQRSLAARDSKASRGELRIGLPPGYCWDELGRIDLDPNERVMTAIRLVLRKFRELGSVRQVLLWARDHEMKIAVSKRRHLGTSIVWCAPAYHNVLNVVRHPMYAGAYVFGRTCSRMKIEEGRARKTTGHRRLQEQWPVLIRDHHPGYITWDEFVQNQAMLMENAHMKKRAARKSGRGGRALLTGLLRCARCGRMLHVFYGSKSGHAHRYLCRGDEMRGARGTCVGVGGVRVDKEVSRQLLVAVTPHAVDAAISAAERATTLHTERLTALQHELDDARYEAALSQRRYEAVDPDKRLVARELESRWETSLERVSLLERKLEQVRTTLDQAPTFARERLLALAHDLPSVWNRAGLDMKPKQRIVRALVREVVVDVDDEHHEVAIAIHWIGGRHTELRVRRNKAPSFPVAKRGLAVDIIRKMAASWSDREIAMALNRMRCRAEDGGTWTQVRVRETRQRLGLAGHNGAESRRPTVSADAAAHRLGIAVPSVHKLIREGVLPATQIAPGAPWEIPVAALDSEAVRIGTRKIIARRPNNTAALQDLKTLRLPGV